MSSTTWQRVHEVEQRGLPPWKITLVEGGMKYSKEKR
jgi:hypothetical protein